RIGTPLLPRFTSWSTSRISGSDSDSDYRSALVWLPRGLMALVVPAVPVVTAPAAPAPGGARTCVAEHPYAEHPRPVHPGPDSPPHVSTSSPSQTPLPGTAWVTGLYRWAARADSVRSGGR